MSWYTEGPKAAPIAGTVLAITPVTVASTGSTSVIIAASMAFQARLEVLDASNNPTFSMVITLGMQDTKQLEFNGLDTNAGGVIRLVTVALVVGILVQGAINS